MFLTIIPVVIGLLVIAYFYRYTTAKNKLIKFAAESSARGYKTKLLPFELNQYYIAKYSTQDENSLKVFKQEWCKQDVIVGNVFSKLGLMIGKPELIKDLCNQMSKFQVSPFIAEVFEILNGGGLLFTEGEIWKRKRRIISSVFHFDFLNNMIPMIETEIENSFSQLDKRIQAGQKEINLRKMFTIILSKVVVKSFFGVDINQYQIQGKPYCEYYLQYLEELGEFIWAWEHIFFGMKCYDYKVTQKCRDIRRKYELLHGITKQFTQKQITRIRNGQEKGKNMLTSLYENNMLSFQGKQNDTQYTMYELIGQFFTFIAAGTDTTANTLNLALHYLSDRPEWVEKIKQESQETNLQAQSSQKLKKLKVSEAIFNQTLRHNGPVAYMFSREALEDVTIGDNLLIPKGTFVTVSPLMCHYREQIYKNPDQFMPDRWLEERKNEPYTFLPFSGGQRNCIGQYLARIEGKLILSKICQRYSFKALNPIKMKIRFSYSTQGDTFEVKKLQEN